MAECLFITYMPLTCDCFNSWHYVAREYVLATCKLGKGVNGIYEPSTPGVR